MNEGFPFWIKRFIHSRDSNLKPHIHDFIELTFVVGGEADHLFEGERYPIASGDVFIINPGEVHNYDIQPGKQLEIINCLFMPHLIEDSVLLALKLSNSMDYFYVQPFLDKRERFNHRLRLHNTEVESVLLLLEDMIKEKEQSHSGYAALIRLKLIELLILLSRFYHSNQASARTQARSGDLVVRRICGYLERHYHQKISLPSLSNLFSISVRQLNRLFKKEAGMSVIEALHEIRVERAKQMLLETDEKIITVAGMVGYENPAFFSRLFTRLAGCSPGKYRNDAREVAALARQRDVIQE